MQTPKSRTGSLEAPQRKSPATTPRTARQLKVPVADSEAFSPPFPASKTPKDRSPKVVERKSPRNPMSEKKRPSRASELESQLAQLQEDLRKAKEQLNASESSKKKAQRDADDAKKQLSALSEKLEESEQQLMEISASEDSRVQELRKISQDRDRTWESELEAVRKQHTMDSAALASSLNEIQKLKLQLEKAYDSEAVQTKHAESAHAEIQKLRIELSETLSLVENLKIDIANCRESEAEAIEAVNRTQMQLETAHETVEMLRSESKKATEDCQLLTLELEQSKTQVQSLEELASKMQSESVHRSSKLEDPEGDDVSPSKRVDEREKLCDELNAKNLEMSQLRSALDAAEIRYQEEYIQSTLQIRSAYEQVEHLKAESAQRGVELEAELEKAKAEIEQLQRNLVHKEAGSHSIEKHEELGTEVDKNKVSERESELEVELTKLASDLAELKASISAKEIELKSVIEQNEMLKMEIGNRKVEGNKVNDEAVAMAEAAEQEALQKLGSLSEEADNSSRRVERVTEQLDAAQAANTELEAELRRLKVQSDQWRKAAEAAAAMLSTGNNGKLVDRTGSLDITYSPVSGNMDSPYSEDIDDDKKKNGNMLKKIGVLWKKGQK